MHTIDSCVRYLQVVVLTAGWDHCFNIWSVPFVNGWPPASCTHFFFSNIFNRAKTLVFLTTCSINVVGSSWTERITTTRHQFSCIDILFGLNSRSSGRILSFEPEKESSFCFHWKINTDSFLHVCISAGCKTEQETRSSCKYYGWSFDESDRYSIPKQFSGVRARIYVLDSQSQKRIIIHEGIIKLLQARRNQRKWKSDCLNSNSNWYHLLYLDHWPKNKHRTGHISICVKLIIGSRWFNSWFGTVSDT